MGSEVMTASTKISQNMKNTTIFYPLIMMDYENYDQKRIKTMKFQTFQKVSSELFPFGGFS